MSSLQWGGGCVGHRLVRVGEDGIRREGRVGGRRRRRRRRRGAEECDAAADGARKTIRDRLLSKRKKERRSMCMMNAICI